MAGFHHVELWVSDLPTATREWGWLLGRLGFVPEGSWSDGCSWGAGGVYLTVVTPPGVRAVAHDRRRPGVNHLAFDGGSPQEVDALMADGPSHGWTPLYQDRYPHAGGPDSYAGWLENTAGEKAEVVATTGPPAPSTGPPAPGPQRTTS